MSCANGRRCDALDPSNHLFGCPPRKREQRDAVWIHPVDDEVGDPMGERLGFARSGASDDQKRPCTDHGSSFNAVLNSLPLLFVQIIEVIKRHCCYSLFSEKTLLQLLIRIRIVILNHFELV
jgi:hypothetical protein